jgi:hypothetical protein
MMVVAFAMCMLAGLAQAAAEVQLAAWKVVAERAAEGTAKERLEPVQQLQPGDTIEYRATYAADAQSAARNVQITLPVPQAGLVWQPWASAPEAGVPMLASRDGERFEPVPLMRAEQLPDGRRVMRAVPLSEYRFLRWQLGDLPAGATRMVRARMRFAAPGTAPVAAIPAAASAR